MKSPFYNAKIMIQANAMTHDEFMELLNEIDDYFEQEESMDSEVGPCATTHTERLDRDYYDSRTVTCH